MTPFMIADRGHCHFVNKIRNMEDLGAAVAIVVDNRFEDIKSVIMTDDGSGQGIRIPSLLIGKKDGQILIDFLNTATDDEMD